jgi:AbiJ N-terminal domain 4
VGYFSDRHVGPPPRVATEIPEAVRDGITGLIRNRAHDGSFGSEYPEQCPDGRGPTGTDTNALREALRAHRLYDPFGAGVPPPTTIELLDLVEFGHEKIAEPHRAGHHGFLDHYHLVFDQGEGRARFRAELNRIFERNGIAFELREDGRVERIAPEGLREALSQAMFNTGDDTLNALLERARTRFLSPNPATRRESLEALWDAWERIKSIELPTDKKESTKRILDRGSGGPNFRPVLEDDARFLTNIGNAFMIRHAEVGKIPIDDNEHVDFLFHRLFAMIRLLLRKSNRGG